MSDNRIYFVNDEQNSHDTYVLKVNGKSLDSSKIDNEVSCLLLLQHYYPTLPVPRVIAWCGDGTMVTVDNEQGTDSQKSTLPLEAHSSHRWILMTRLKGDSMDPLTLSAASMSDLSKQLAEIVISWRRLVPKSRRCGNLLFPKPGTQPSAHPLYRLDAGLETEFDIDGILNVAGSTGLPIKTLLSYWQIKLSCAIRKLVTEETYAPNREALSNLLENFVEKTLPDLSLFRNSREDEEGFLFSHTDLSPRNVLVSGSPPQITGFVDFEYAGFFPCLEDFTGFSIISEHDDPEGWPVSMHLEILQRMEEAGEVTPLNDASEWRDFKSLARLETHIAPWWIEELDAATEESRSQLDEAKVVVEDTISSLRSNIN